MGHSGLMQLSKLASDQANAFLAHVPREHEGEASTPWLSGQQCLLQKQLELMEINLKADREEKLGE